MESFKVEEMDGTKIVRSVSVEAQSHVHAVVKAIPRPLKPGRVPGRPWIRVTDANRISREFSSGD